MPFFPAAFPTTYPSGGQPVQAPCADVPPPAGAEAFLDPVTGLAWVEHCARGKGNLLQQFQGKPRLEALLCSWLCQVQNLENVSWALKLLRGLTTAEGVQLDHIGDLVGEPDRRGATDTAYRVRIIARIAVNLSNGRRGDLLNISALVLGAGAVVGVYETYPASLLYWPVEPVADPGSYLRILRAAKGAGVRLGLLFSAAPAIDTFYSGSVYAPAILAPTQYTGSVYAPAVGGLMASVTI